MPYIASNTAARKKASRKIINIHQKEFSKGYISTYANSRRPLDSFADMTNMEIVQDNIARPRPPLVPYGTQPAFTVVGRGKYNYSGTRYILYMMNVSGVGVIYKQADGGAITSVGGSYSVSAWSMFTQSAGKVYIYNGIDALSYINLATNTIVTYTSLPVPSAPTATGSTNLISGTKPYNYYYKVTANNAVGESAASLGSGAVNVNSVRDDWSSDTTIAKTVAVSWSAVTGAVSYTLYVGDVQGNEKELVTLNARSYTDDGSLATNAFKLAPEGNSTAGPILTWLYNDSKNSQLFGVGVDNKMYYSSPGSTNASADFSPYNGGGYVAIDPSGDTNLNFVEGFRNGKGDPVITTSSRGAAGKGKLHHVDFQTLNIGDQVIVYPNVYEANGQSATYAPRATVRARDSIYYPTGAEFKTTGTSQNIVNILTTTSTSQVIEPDVDNISLASLDGAVGVEYKDIIYFALPVGSDENNEIWYIDLSRKNLWVLRWPVSVTDMWLYEDSGGLSHLCVLSNNRVLEFTRRGSQTTQDDGIPFGTRLAFSSMTWDESGVTLANIYRQYFKLLQPRGSIKVNAYGLSKKGITANVASNTFTQTVSFTGYDVYQYDQHQYDEDPGQINSYGKAVTVVTLKPKGLINQEDWELITEDANCDYSLSAVNTRGSSRDTLIFSA